MNILGISCYYHDAACCIVKDGVLVAAVQEERLNRIKNSSDFPVKAINYCIQQANISFNQIDYVAFYEKPFLKFSRVIFDHINAFPFSYLNFLYNIPLWLQDRLVLPLVLKRELGYNGKTIFVKHHMAHASSTFLVSPFDEAAIITVDGVGEYATASVGFGRNNNIEIRKEIHYPHSLGLLYSAITGFLGFKINSGEGTTMALASYGNPVYIDEFNKLIKVNNDGSFKMNPKYFGFIKGKTMFSRKFVGLFGNPRKPGEDYSQKYRDIAATLQYFVEEILIKIANNTYNETPSKNLCLAGGVFLNCVANQKIIDNTPFENIFIQPAAGDAGASVGAALNLYNCILGNQRKYVMKHAYLGPEYPNEQLKRIVINNNLKYTEYNDEELLRVTAQHIHENKIMGWFQGKLEFGPRALGNRSILANATNPQMVDILNKRIKNREWFRPFAPIVPEEYANEYFEMTVMSPFMLLAPKVKQITKDKLPAITHVDDTARVQTVNKESNQRLHALLLAYQKISGIPVIINTSFNLKAEPIVCSPQEAIDDFLKCEMDYLVLGNYLIEK